MKRVKNRMNKIGQVLCAWETSAADKTFAGMTLQEFKAELKTFEDAQATMEERRLEFLSARYLVIDESKAAYKKALLVVNSLKGDPNYGDDSGLYAEMGYIRKSTRKSGLTRKVNSTESPVV